MEFIREVRPEIIDIDGTDAIALNIYSDDFKKTMEFLTRYNISILPVNVRMYNKILSDEDKMSEKYYLKLELSTEDPFPNKSFDCYFTTEEAEIFRKINEESEIVYINLKSYNTSKNYETMLIQENTNFIIDWSGMLGYLIKLRFNSELTPEKIDKNIEFLATLRMSNDKINRLNTELGYLFKMANRLDAAKSCFLKEISNSAGDKKYPDHTGVRAIQHLATVFKIEKDAAKAFELYKLAININPNYFEPYLSMVGLLGDYKLQLKCLARAYKIRKNDSNIGKVIGILSEVIKKDVETIINEMNMLVDSIDLKEKLHEFAIENYSMEYFNQQ